MRVDIDFEYFHKFIRSFDTINRASIGATVRPVTAYSRENGKYFMSLGDVLVVREHIELEPTDPEEEPSNATVVSYKWDRKRLALVPWNTPVIAEPNALRKLKDFGKEFNKLHR